MTVGTMIFKQLRRVVDVADGACIYEDLNVDLFSDMCIRYFTVRTVSHHSLMEGEKAKAFCSVSCLMAGVGDGAWWC